jgi:hypothetical protein
MPFNLGLLSDAALTGLSDEEKSSLQKQATQQFLLGSLLSNDASMGLKSALSVPDQYLSGQRAITEMQQKAADRASVANFQGRYMPTQFNEASPQYMGPVTPDVAMQQNELKTARAQGLPFNIQNALQDVLNLPTSSQGPMRETISALKPTMQPSGILTNANMQPIGGLPTFDAKTGLVSTPTVQGGNVDFNISSAPGYAKATALNTIPKLKENQEFVFDRNQNAIGVRNMDGTIQAIQAVATAEQMGKGLANLQTTPTDVIDVATGRKKRVTEATALGMPTALSASETQAYEAYKPIRDDAFKKFQAASSSDTSLQNMQNILNRGAFKPGRFAEAQSEIASIATGLGIGGQAAKNMAVDAPLLLQTFADTVSTNIQDMSGAISNADVIFQKQRGPQIRNPEEAIQYYIDLKESLNKRSKDYYNYVAKNPVPDVVEKWSQTPQGSASLFEDPKLRKYLPKFPVTQGPDKGKTAYRLPTGSIVLFD